MFSSKPYLPQRESLPDWFQSLFSWMFSSKTGETMVFHRLIPCFNPCSLGCFPRSPSLRIVHPGGMVSILVLLDVFLEEDACPCCRRECTVSILVLLDVFLEVDLPPTQCFLLWEFQSLFSWMFSSKYVAIAERRLEKGFNPCSLGCFPRSCNAVGTGP